MARDKTEIQSNIKETASIEAKTQVGRVNGSHTSIETKLSFRRRRKNCYAKKKEQKNKKIKANRHVFYFKKWQKQKKKKKKALNFLVSC